MFTFENRAHALGGVSGVASFITTDKQLQQNRGCYFPMQALLHEGFPFSMFNSHQMCNFIRFKEKEIIYVTIQGNFNNLLNTK